MKPRPRRKIRRRIDPDRSSLRDQILTDFTTLRVPVRAEQLDGA